MLELYLLLGSYHVIRLSYSFATEFAAKISQC